MVSKIGIIAAVSADGAIARGGRIPWDEPADRARFKRLTLESTVIMGRRTWEELPFRPLPRRTNLVLSGGHIDGAQTFRRLEDAIGAARGAVWLIGGHRVFSEGFAHADLLDITRIPVEVGAEDRVSMPPIPLARFEITESFPHPDDPRLAVERWTRRAAR